MKIWVRIINPIYFIFHQSQEYLTVFLLFKINALALADASPKRLAQFPQY